MQQNNELREFARAVARYKRGSNIPPLDVSEVDYPDDEWDDTKQKLARRAFRNLQEQNDRKEEQLRFGFRVLMAVESIDQQWNHEPHMFDPKHGEGVFLQIRCVPISQYFLLLPKLHNIDQITPIISRCATPPTYTGLTCMTLCKVWLLVRRRTTGCEIGTMGRSHIYEDQYGLAQ